MVATLIQALNPRVSQPSTRTLYLFTPTNPGPRYVGKTTRVDGATAAQIQAGQGLAWPCDLVLSLANRPQTIDQLKQRPASQIAAARPRPFALPDPPHRCQA